jgi:hypothetical protein
MNKCSERRGIVPLILNLFTRWRTDITFTPWPLCCREKTSLPIEEEARWAPEPVWAFRRRVESLALTGIRTLDCPTRI